MRYNAVFASQYRKNGYVFVAYDFGSGYYDLYIQHPNGEATWFDTFRSKSKAVKEAKEVAMTEKLGFNVDTDVIL